MAHRDLRLDEADHIRVTEGVAKAESGTAGEIVTIVARRSDSYNDIALAWAALAAFTELVSLSVFPDFHLGLVDRIGGHWGREWTPQGILTLAACWAIATFILAWLLQLWQPLKFALIPRGVKAQRVRNRAETCFKVGAERRTHGRTGILIYVSLAEHRAEIVADAAIAAKVAPEVWGEAMAAMLVEIRAGRLADGMIAAAQRVGVVLAEHFPRAEDDVNELPDRLIEV